MLVGLAARKLFSLCTFVEDCHVALLFICFWTNLQRQFHLFMFYYLRVSVTSLDYLAKKFLINLKDKAFLSCFKEIFLQIFVCYFEIRGNQGKIFTKHCSKLKFQESKKFIWVRKRLLRIDPSRSLKRWSKLNHMQEK